MPGLAALVEVSGEVAHRVAQAVIKDIKNGKVEVNEDPRSGEAGREMAEIERQIPIVRREEELHYIKAIKASLMTNR